MRERKRRRFYIFQKSGEVRRWLRWQHTLRWIEAHEPTTVASSCSDGATVSDDPAVLAKTEPAV